MARKKSRRQQPAQRKLTNGPQENGGENSSAKKNGRHGNLTLYIIAGIIGAIVVALLWPTLAMKFELGGEIFLRLLQMVVVPLVMASVMSGILGMGDVRKLGRPGGYAVMYYLCTTVLAVATGLIVVNIINPGKNIDRKLVEGAKEDGAQQVEKAQEAMRARIEPITWASGPSGTRRVSDGVSEAIRLSDEKTQVLTVNIVQESATQSPAEVRLKWRPELETGDPENEGAEEADSFHTLEETLTAPSAPGSYQWKIEFPPSRKTVTITAAHEEGGELREVPLQQPARWIRLDYIAQQGDGSSTLTAELAPGPPGMGDILKNLALMLFTNNLLGSMVEINLLPLIVFSLVFAGMLTTMGKSSEAIGNLVVSINEALLNFILLLMMLAPIGIFCLVAARFGKAAAEGNLIELFTVQFKYMATVLIGLGVHAGVTLPLIYWLCTRKNPYVYFVRMSQAVLTAFSTASSSATLPVTMETAQTRGGVSNRSTKFVLPLGATINMDGTALYEAAAAIFIAVAFAEANPEYALGFGKQMTIAITATLAAIGAAGIPEAGLVTMLIVLNAVGLPLELIGLILPVDWLLDRFRTAVNVFGDSVGAAVVDPTFPD